MCPSLSVSCLGSLVLLAASASCATSPLGAPVPPGYADPGNAPVAYSCGDTVLADQATSGGQPLTTFMPCWDYQDEAEHDHLVMAPGAPTDAGTERQAANGLVESEIAACAHIPVRERDHSPFAHRRSIAQVVPYFESGVLHGVRVVFKPVVALSAAWMRADIACHQAHVAVLGAIPESLRQDPTLVDTAEVTVSDAGGHLTVLVRSDSADQAALALAKALGQGPSTTTAIRN